MANLKRNNNQIAPLRNRLKVVTTATYDILPSDYSIIVDSATYGTSAANLPEVLDVLLYTTQNGGNSTPLVASESSLLNYQFVVYNTSISSWLRLNCANDEGFVNGSSSLFNLNNPSFLFVPPASSVTVNMFSSGFNGWFYKIDNNWQTSLFNDFTTHTGSTSDFGEFETLVNGSGAAATVTGGWPIDSALGEIELETGTTSTGRAAVIGQGTTGFFAWGGLGSHDPNGPGYVIKISSRFKLDELSTGTQRYTIRSGLGLSVTGDSSEGIYFRYSDNVNSGMWEAVTRNSSDETAISTGVAATTGYHTYDITINMSYVGYFYTVDYSIDGITVASIGTTTVDSTRPSNSDLRWLPLTINKSIGGTSVLATIDWYKVSTLTRVGNNNFLV